MVNAYLDSINEDFKTGLAREHAYRSAFGNLIKSILPVRVINEPTRSQHGNPDFVFLDEKNNDLILGYAETKDLGMDLNKVENSEQLKRYLGYSHLILTNYLEFRFFRNGVKYQTIEIASMQNGQIVSQESYFPFLESELKAFLQTKPETITSAKRLSEIMGGKAFRIRENIKEFLNQEANEKNQQILKMFQVMRSLLVHDLTYEQFADMYAQTLVYGLFVARYFDETPESFSRQEATGLIPASNPFLQDFFEHIAGARFEKRLAYIVDELCDVFSVTDIQWIIHQHFNLFGEDESKDPIIHFYEDFLKEYDPVQRKVMGAYYTPIPVVDFMVRSVDEILKRDFSIQQGLADTSLITRQVVTTGRKEKETLHKVQVLDPAVGTATFLNQIIKFIYNNNFVGQEGSWPSYVTEHLLSRLYGFELMMAPYTIAHLKLGMTLRELGYKEFQKRLGVYLTNSLEEGVKAQTDLFEGLGLMESITKESQAASDIKQNKPIMVVIGNPPYSVSSSNKGEWIQKLIEDYKKNLNERNIQPLSDDYIKFIRFAEHFIEKNGSGIVAMITNNSFLDGIIHRQMRKHLLETFDDIYVLDLHGNSKKKEVAPDGSKDENVFDIQQGVSISIMVRKESKKIGLGTVHYAELYGKRKDKFDYFNKKSLEIIQWKIIKYSEPYYFFVPKNFDLQEEYDRGLKVDKLFVTYTSGIKTHDDANLVSFEPFLENNKPYLYRPFDVRWIDYDLKKVLRHRFKVMKDMLRPNLSIILPKICKGPNGFDHGLVTNVLADVAAGDRFSGSGTNIFPLYSYLDDHAKVPNFKKEIIDIITNKIGDTSPEDILDYIYAVIYSPTYREKYKEFLKIDFPRIPYPKNAETFKKLVASGTQLRELHLLESEELNQFITTYPIIGSNIVEKCVYEDGKVYINGTQYFGNVPEIVWNFYIGGYQPAQKWLKDRKGRGLTNEDITHYQKIIKVLMETDKIMKEIDKIDFL